MRLDGVGLLIGIIALWQAVVSFGILSGLFIASPLEIVSRLAELFLKGIIWQDIAGTGWRTLVAFAFSACLGTVLGISSGYFKKARHSTEPIIDFLRSMPPIALLPLFIFALGIGDWAKIGVSAFMGTMIVTVAAMQGTKQVKKARLLLARKLGLRGRKLFTQFLLPETLPAIFPGYRLAASLCLILTIMAEMFLGGEFGLGKRLVDAQMLYRVPELYALIIIAGILGYSVNLVLLLLETKTVHWKGK